MRFVHQDSLGSTSLTTSSTGAVVATVKYFPFGVCQNSQGTLDTDKLFTGQRLDDTGLYYYNARYYDATIGRFISPDTAGTNRENPQSWNRYSYCINNPLNYIDPSGFDIIFVGGNGQTEADLKAYYNDLVSQGIIDPAVDPVDKCAFLYDTDPPTNVVDVDVNPRLEQLRTELNSGDHKDIKLLGFSEGAATVGEYLAQSDQIPGSVKGELRAAVMLECTAGGGADLVTKGFSRSDLNNLPNKLASTGFDIKLADVWNTASIVHGGQLQGWGGNSYSYDSRPWYERAFCSLVTIATLGMATAAIDIYRTARTSAFHNNIWGNSYANKIIKSTFYKK